MSATPPPIHPTDRLLGGMREFVKNQIDFVVGTRESGPTVRVEIGPPGLRRTVCVLHTPDGAETLLSAKTAPNFRKDAVLYQEIRNIMGDGILTAQDEDWLRQKRFVQPVFTRARVDSYLQIMLEEIDALAASWRSEPEVQLDSAMQHLTLRIVGRVLFGEGLDDLEATIAAEFPRASTGILKRAAFAGKIPLSWPLPVNRNLRAAQGRLYEVVDQIIAERRESGERGDDLISLLLDARDGEEQLSDDEVRDQVLIFLLAGHETTSSALTFALHLLGRHPEIQQRVRDEVASVVGDGQPSPSQVHAGLPLTTGVIKEAMRMYPSAPFIGRRPAQACEVDGFAIPASMDTVISVWSIHHDPELWPNPDSFEPDRFVGQEPANRYAWIPFGAGPRACIGQHFSMLESVAALGLLVRAFELESVAKTDRIPVNSAITLYPLEPVRATLRSLIPALTD